MIKAVEPDHTPNQGRLIWNANDQVLQAMQNMLALNVKSMPYAAAGDGLADDRSAIQSAIDDCSKSGGGAVFLPAGTYLLNSGPLLLKNRVHLFGAGMFTTEVKLGAGLSTPVISDESAGRAGAYAFGIVHLANFSINGNAANAPAGGSGIFTTAYFSIFENLYIHDCAAHGIQMGFAEMLNQASQNRISGCRMTQCAGAGIYIDINGVDHTICENYIERCDSGLVIENGGIRVENNDIFGNRSAGISITQTTLNMIIANNDLNANHRENIFVTRTLYANSGPWGHLMIANNSILGDGLAEDNRYDGIHVVSAVANGIANLSIQGNKVFTLEGTNQFRYGINLEKNVIQTQCLGNHILNPKTGRYYVDPSCADIEIDRLGGMVLAAPPVPASGQALRNPFFAPVTFYLSGGAVSAVAIGDSITGLTSGAFRLPAGQTITLTYSAAPGWIWVAD